MWRFNEAYEVLGSDWLRANKIRIAGVLMVGAQVSWMATFLSDQPAWLSEWTWAATLRRTLRKAVARPTYLRGHIGPPQKWFATTNWTGNPAVHREYAAADPPRI